MPRASAVAWRFHWLASSTFKMICRSGASRASFSVRVLEVSTASGLAASKCDGQVLQADHRVLAQQHGPLDHVLQFADVAGPTEALQGGHGLLAEAADLLAGLAADLAEEMLGQQGDVGNAVAQAGQLDVDHVDAIVQVLAETAFGHRPAQVLVRGQDHAGIDLEGLRAADLLELQVLQDAEQLDLHAGTGRGDLVEEDRARRRPA